MRVGAWASVANEYAVWAPTTNAGNWISSVWCTIYNQETNRKIKTKNLITLENREWTHHQKLYIYTGLYTKCCFFEPLNARGPPYTYELTPTYHKENISGEVQTMSHILSPLTSNQRNDFIALHVHGPPAPFKRVSHTNVFSRDTPACLTWYNKRGGTY